MTIPANQIVAVTPSVESAGGTGLDLLGMILTESTRVPIGTVASFPDATSVGLFFGLNSKEASVATVYFNGYDNSQVKPGAILFTQYPGAAVAAYLRGGNISGLTLTQLQALTGSLTVTVDGYARTAASVVLSADNSFSAAAATIQTDLNTSPVTIATFTAAIAATVMTVSGSVTGTIAVGQTVVGAGVATGTIITALGNGTGGDGTYTVNNSQSVGSESMTTTATPVVVTYDSVSGAFIVTSGITGVASTAVFATGTIASGLMLTSATGAVVSQGAATTTPSAFMTALTLLTQNWASFMTAFDPDGGSGNTLKLAFSAWTNGQNQRYAYICWDTDITPTNSVPASASLGQLIAAAGYSGTCLIYEPSDLNLAPFICGAIASVDFDAENGRITFMGKSQSGLLPSVTSGTVAQNLIANNYNFYGAYATANDGFTFFNPGSVSGKFKWLDSYINQIWLNNAFQLAFMELITNVNSIPYNTAGNQLIEAAAADPINAGLNFGAFSAGITLSAQQIAEVNAKAGKNIAPALFAQGFYFQVQPSSPQTRVARSSPPCNFFYADGGSVQQINLNSIAVQ